MSRLINRQNQIPNGMTFYEPKTKWKPAPYSSFESIVQNLIAHRKANASLKDKSTDYNDVANEVDMYNANLCQSMGWTDYITDAGGASAPPKSKLPHNLNVLGNVAAGAKSILTGAQILIDWIKDGSEAVPAEQAESRAKVCKDCPMNGTGGWTAYFTEPVAAAIKTQLEKRKGMQLSTSSDASLGVCSVCSCPIPLKVHVKNENIWSRMSSDTVEKLPDHCWILTERK